MSHGSAEIAVVKRCFGNIDKEHGYGGRNKIGFFGITCPYTLFFFLPDTGDKC
jgi:hypothetical protein